MFFPSYRNIFFFFESQERAFDVTPADNVSKRWGIFNKIKDDRTNSLFAPLVSLWDFFTTTPDLSLAAILNIFTLNKWWLLENPLFHKINSKIKKYTRFQETRKERKQTVIDEIIRHIHKRIGYVNARTRSRRMHQWDKKDFRYRPAMWHLRRSAIKNWRLEPFLRSWVNFWHKVVDSPKMWKGAFIRSDQRLKPYYTIKGRKRYTFFWLVLRKYHPVPRKLKIDNTWQQVINSDRPKKFVRYVKKEPYKGFWDTPLKKKKRRRYRWKLKHRSYFSVNWDDEEGFIWYFYTVRLTGHYYAVIPRTEKFFFVYKVFDEFWDQDISWFTCLTHFHQWYDNYFILLNYIHEINDANSMRTFNTVYRVAVDLVQGHWNLIDYLGPVISFYAISWRDYYLTLTTEMRLSRLKPKLFWYITHQYSSRCRLMVVWDHWSYFHKGPKSSPYYKMREENRPTGWPAFIWFNILYGKKLLAPARTVVTRPRYRHESYFLPSPRGSELFPFETQLLVWLNSSRIPDLQPVRKWMGNYLVDSWCPKLHKFDFVFKKYRQFLNCHYDSGYANGVLWTYPWHHVFLKSTLDTHNVFRFIYTSYYKLFFWTLNVYRSKFVFSLKKNFVRHNFFKKKSHLKLTWPVLNWSKHLQFDFQHDPELKIPEVAKIRYARHPAKKVPLDASRVVISIWKLYAFGVYNEMYLRTKFPTKSAVRNIDFFCSGYTAYINWTIVDDARVKCAVQKFYKYVYYCKSKKFYVNVQHFFNEIHKFLFLTYWHILITKSLRLFLRFFKHLSFTVFKWHTEWAYVDLLKNISTTKVYKSRCVEVWNNYCYSAPDVVDQKDYQIYTDQLSFQGLYAYNRKPVNLIETYLLNWFYRRKKLDSAELQVWSKKIFESERAGYLVDEKPLTNYLWKNSWNNTKKIRGRDYEKYANQPNDLPEMLNSPATVRAIAYQIEMLQKEKIYEQRMEQRTKIPIKEQVLPLTKEELATVSTDEAVETVFRSIEKELGTLRKIKVRVDTVNAQKTAADPAGLHNLLSDKRRQPKKRIRRRWNIK